MLFRNVENKAGYVLEYIDKTTLVKSLEPEKFGKYDHFEAMKPNKDYLQRRSSGPVITFSQFLSNLFHDQPYEQFGNIHEPLDNIKEPRIPLRMKRVTALVFDLHFVLPILKLKKTF